MTTPATSSRPPAPSALDFDLRTSPKAAAARYRQDLEEQILPFWLRHAPDALAGGYITCLDHDGRSYDYDKVCLWGQGRIAWTFARMACELAPRPEYLAMARRGVEFLEQKAFRPDGRMSYALTRAGLELQPPQDVYCELSAVLAFAELARAEQRPERLRRAETLFLSVWNLLQEPGRAHQPFNPNVRPARLHGHSMIVLNVLQELRKAGTNLPTERFIDSCLDSMLRLHLRPGARLLLELVGWDGEDLPGWQGRYVNPGHMIEGGTFLIHEGEYRHDPALVAQGVNLIEWGFEQGWDREFGGLFNDRDAAGLPIPTGAALLADSKLWWQHAEALYGLLLAWERTGRPQFLDAYDTARAYVRRHFLLDHGEWRAILDRRGNPLNDVVGTDRKNTFHIARNYLLCAQRLAGAASG